MTCSSRAHLPFGAAVADAGVRFAVWAPKASRVDVEIIGDGVTRSWRLSDLGDGVYAGLVPDLGAGARYRFRLDGGPSFPDPWSRSQPEGVHGPSEAVDPNTFQWTDHDWRGVDREGLVLYEVHVGTYTPEGTFDALARELPQIRSLGITAIELMPVAEFPGRWNWGYDGVFLFAPSHVYGGVESFKHLIDTAHRHGLAVLLDVVYNHLGPDGNYLRAYSDDYFSTRHATPWGEAINYDGPNCRRVRELVIENARYWLREYHLDGLRLDATHAIFDDSPTPLLAEIVDAAHTEVGASRKIYLFAEDGRNDVRLIRPREAGGIGLDGVWADDFHHAVHVLVTGEREGYYADYDGSADAVARTITGGFLYQGQHSVFRDAPRGTTVTDEPASAFVFCLQNHDQVGNRAFGERLHHLVDVETYAVASALLVLAPELPLLFMGQEFATGSPFLYFTDHHDALGRLVTEGRRREFARFSAFADAATRDQIPDPQSETTFWRSKLRLEERQEHAWIYDLYRRLLWLRQTDPVFRHPDRRTTDSGALGQKCVIVRRELGAQRRLIAANFGAEILALAAEVPLLSWLGIGSWRVLLSTQHQGANVVPSAVTTLASEAGVVGEPRQVYLPAKTAIVWACE